MNTTEKGNLTEIKIAVRLLERGKTVLRPVGDGCRYDLLVDEAGKFSRIQCKTGCLRNGVVRFKSVSYCSWKPEVRKYTGQCDLFGVYCPDNDGYYLVPVEKIASRIAYLRVTPAKNGQLNGILHAAQFQI